MEQYIDKSALVAEIDRLDALYHLSNSLGGELFIEGLRSFIKTDVKEVDFEKELDRIWFDNKFGDMFDNSAVDFANVREICRHFFELGLQAQKGE